MNVIKRDCSLEEFDKNKIYIAIVKAMSCGNGIKTDVAQKIANEIENELLKEDIEEVEIYRIESMVFDKLIQHKQKLTAKEYEGYRRIREFQREVVNTTDNDILKLVYNENEYLIKENSNKNAILETTKRDYIAGTVSKDISSRYIFSPQLIQAHNEGIIHIHDLDYQLQHITNCCLINLEDMLQNGTVINGVKIDKPKTFKTACTIATQIITAVASSQYGGTTITLTHLAPFVRDSYNKLFKKYKNRGFHNFECEKFVNEDLKEEIRDGVQTFNYQINSMSTTNGQAPFITVFMYLNETKEYKKELAMIIEEFLRQRIQGMKNKVGIYVTQSFPKLIYALEDDNITENSKYWYLTELSAKCSVKRLVPDYISEKVMKELKEGNCFPSMGCRSFLSPYKNENNNEYKFYGRFNKGVVTLNLVDVALSSNKNIDKFWDIMNQRIELCHKALKTRYEWLKGTKSDASPILWQDGAFARLKQNEPIDNLLKGGYSSISLGYAGLYECVKYMTNNSHTDNGIGEELGLKVMQFMADKCVEWDKDEQLGYSIYGTPIESTTYKFAKCLKERFGDNVFIQIDGKDRNYITNSYHVPVFETIDAFSKLSLESKFQSLSSGGAISYIEIPNMKHNIEAILSVMQFIYENIMYAELNTKSDYCMECGFDGEIKIVKDDNNKLVWECPQCKNRDESTMNITRRTCGLTTI